MLRRMLRLATALTVEAALIGAALLAVSLLLAIPKHVTWTYPGGWPVPHADGMWTRALELWQPLLSGSLGTNGNGKYLVSDLIARPARYSLVLLLIGFVLAAVLGVLKGLWDFRAMRVKRFSLVPGLTAFMQGLPDYWVILMAQWGVVTLIYQGLKIPLLPAYDAQHPIAGLILPVLIMSLIPAGAIAHITGEALVDADQTDSVRTARAKGLAPGRVLWTHTLRLALVEVLDNLPAVLTMMLTNLMVVEYLTEYPGLSKFLILGLKLSTKRGEFPEDSVAFGAAVILLTAFFLALEGIRLLRRLVDPRLREEVRR